MKGVIHLREKMTSESEIGFHCRFKCDTSVYEALCDEELEFGIVFRGTKLGEGQLGCAEGPMLG